MATASHFLLRRDSVNVQPAVHQAMAKLDFPADFVRPEKETESRQVVVAVSFEARFSPAPDLAAAVPSAVCRCPIRFATAGFVPAADPFDPAGSDFPAVAAVVVAAVAGLSAADLSVVDADPGSVGFAVAAVDLACSAYFSAAALGKGRVVAVAFCFLIPRSSF